MEGRSREVRYYVRPDGTVVVQVWLDGIKDHRTRARLQIRIDRLEDGQFGDARSVGGGVLELRCHFGKGYRIYVAVEGTRLVLLLCGGDKGTQPIDIRKAQAYRTDYLKRRK